MIEEVEVALTTYRIVCDIRGCGRVQASRVHFPLRVNRTAEKNYWVATGVASYGWYVGIFGERCPAHAPCGQCHGWGHLVAFCPVALDDQEVVA